MREAKNEVQIHTIFFDVGGTLVESPGFFSHVASHVCAENRETFGEDLKWEFLEGFRDEKRPFATVTDTLSRSLRSVCTEHSLPDASGRAAELYRDVFIEHAVLYDDVNTVIPAIYDLGITMHIISDADAYLLEEELEVFRIRRFFDRLVISSDVGGYKPSAAMVEAGRALCREPKEGILLVGDAEVDVVTAKRMGVKSVVIRDPDCERLGADYCFDSLEGVLGLLGRWAQGQGSIRYD